MTKLWEGEHPYYATTGNYVTTGNYFVGGSGHRDVLTGSYDGDTHHCSYASWEDFKRGDEMLRSDDEIARRRASGVAEEKLQSHREATCSKCQNEPFCNMKGTWHNADMDYNLLYRWDYNYNEPDEDTAAHYELQLFYILQRKANCRSVSVIVTADDEPEIRAWLTARWHHLMKVWRPLSGFPIGDPTLHEALESASAQMATEAKAAK